MRMPTQTRIVLNGRNAYLIKGNEVIIEGPVSWVRKMAIFMGYSAFID